MLNRNERIKVKLTFEEWESLLEAAYAVKIPSKVLREARSQVSAKLRIVWSTS